MNKIGTILLGFLFLLIAYTLFLKIFPLRKSIFFTNQERVEEFIYGNKPADVVFVGSSLSGMFQERDLYHGNYFALYLPYTGSCSGLEIIRRTGRIPKVLFVEINHINRGIDEALIEQSFDEPFYSLKHTFPFLQKKNQLIPNLIDRIKKPKVDINDKRPPKALYDSLLSTTQQEWERRPDSIDFNMQFSNLKSTLHFLSERGCKVCFYEMPMDSSLRSSPLLVYQRNAVQRFVSQSKYDFIKTDSTRAYHTGDGVHLLSEDGAIYFKYFKRELSKLPKSYLAGMSVR